MYQAVYNCPTYSCCYNLLSITMDLLSLSSYHRKWPDICIVCDMAMRYLSFNNRYIEPPYPHVLSPDIRCFFSFRFAMSTSLISTRTACPWTAVVPGTCPVRHALATSNRGRLKRTLICGTAAGDNTVNDHVSFGSQPLVAGGNNTTIAWHVLVTSGAKLSTNWPYTDHTHCRPLSQTRGHVSGRRSMGG